MKYSFVAMATLALVVGCGGGSDAVDNSGIYEAYSTDGRQASLKVDFKALTYSYSDGQTSRAGVLVNSAHENFTMRASTSSDAAVEGMFTVADNVLVGSIVPLDTVRPNNAAFIAAKSFVQNLSEVDGMKFEVMSRDVDVSTGKSHEQIYWETQRLDGKAGTVSYCNQQDTWPPIAPGAELLLDPASCTNGVLTASLIAQPGAPAGTFKYDDPRPGSTSHHTMRIAKVGANHVLLGTVSWGTGRGFMVGLSGEKSNLTGNFATGWSSLGASTSMSFGPGINAVAFQGGTASAPGSSSSSGSLTSVAGSNAAWRYIPSGSNVPAAGLIVGAGLALKGDLQSNAGGITLFVR